MIAALKEKYARAVFYLNLVLGDNHLETIVPSIYNRKRWRCLATIIFGWTSVSFIFLTYALCAAFYYFAVRQDDWRKTKTFIGVLVSYSAFVVTFVFLILRGSEVTKLIREIIDLCDSIERKIIENLSRWFLAFVVFLTVYSLYLSYLSILQGNTIKNEYQEAHLCFGCNFTTWSPEAFQVFHYTFKALYLPSVVGVSFSQVAFYCFLTKALSDALNNAVPHFTDDRLGNRFNETLQTLRVFREHLSKIRALVNRINVIFKYIILVWFASTLLSTSNEVTNYIRNYSDKNSLHSYFWAMQCRDLVLLVSLTLVASRLSELNDRIYDYLTRLTDTVLFDGETKNMMVLILFNNDFNNQKMGFKAGSCFFITKNLLVSFVGMLITYTIVFIQFNPELLGKLDGIESSNCSVNCC